MFARLLHTTSGGFLRFLTLITLVGCSSMATGCMDLSGRGPAPLEKSIVPLAEAPHQRQGHVYCMRGWLGIFSTGMDALAEEISTEVNAVPIADEEWIRLKNFIIDQKKAGNLNQPLVLIGHSFGADDQIRVARELAKSGINVDLLITIDPVNPLPVPANVKRCLNIYKSHPITDPIPAWRGVAIDPTTSKAPVTNINLREAKVDFDTENIDHVNIEKADGVHRMVIAEIRKVCPPNRSATIRISATDLR